MASDAIKQCQPAPGGGCSGPPGEVNGKSAKRTRDKRKPQSAVSAAIVPAVELHAVSAAGDALSLQERLAQIVARAVEDVGVPFEPAALAIQSEARGTDPALYARHKDALKAARKSIDLHELNRLTKPSPGRSGKFTAAPSAEEADLQDGPHSADGLGCPYRYVGDRMVYTCQTKEGEPSETTLTNFRARIVVDAAEDDGSGRDDAAPVRYYHLECHQRGRVDLIRIPAGDFNSMDWVPVYLGAAHIVSPGAGKAARARHGIQLLSPGLERRTIYTHTGWRKIDGQWVFLHADGAIGPAGPVGGIDVRLEDGLRRYVLPGPPEGADRQEAVRRSLGFLGIADVAQTWPMLANAYAAPTGEALQTNFTGWAQGVSGTRKTAATVLLMNHYGDFTEEGHLPCSFLDTANSTELTCFSAKDVLVPMNDFSPQEDPKAAAAQGQKATQIMRARGNNQGRKRLTRDCQQMGAHPPRGLPFVSSELPVPGSQSGEARSFGFGWQQVDLGRLTQAQNCDRSHYALAMSAYIQWLAGQMDELKETLPDRVRTLARSQDEIGHGRVSCAAAHLICAVELFLQFAVEVGAVTETECAAHFVAAKAAIANCAVDTDRQQAEKRPAVTFLEYLRASLLRGSIYLRDYDTDQAPGADPRRYGWERSGGECEGYYPRSNARDVGWVKDRKLYLVPATIHQVVVEFARSSGAGFPFDLKALGQALDQDELLAQKSEEQRQKRLTFRATVRGGARVHCWVLPEDAIFPASEEPGEGPAGAESTGDELAVNEQARADRLGAPPAGCHAGSSEGGVTADQPSCWRCRRVLPKCGLYSASDSKFLCREAGQRECEAISRELGGNGADSHSTTPDLNTPALALLEEARRHGVVLLLNDRGELLIKSYGTADTRLKGRLHAMKAELVEALQCEAGQRRLSGLAGEVL